MIPYDFSYPFREKNNRLSNFDPVDGFVVYPNGVKLEDCDPNTGKCVPFVPSFDFRLSDTNSVFEPDKVNWAQRIGFAYELTPKTVFRVAYGIFNAAVNPARHALLTSFSAPWLFTPRINVNPDVPNASFEQGFTGPDLLRASSPTLWAPAPIRGLKSAYTQMWNMGLQLGLKSDLILDVAYVGSKGTQATAQMQLNLPPPGAGALQARRPFPKLAGKPNIPITDSRYYPMKIRVKVTLIPPGDMYDGWKRPQDWD